MNTLALAIAQLRDTPAATHPSLAAPFGQLLAAASLEDGYSLARDVYRRSIENLIFVDGGHPDDMPDTATRALLLGLYKALEKGGHRWDLTNEITMFTREYHNRFRTF